MFFYGDRLLLTAIFLNFKSYFVIDNGRGVKLMGRCFFSAALLSAMFCIK